MSAVELDESRTERPADGTAATPRERRIRIAVLTGFCLYLIAMAAAAWIAPRLLPGGATVSFHGHVIAIGRLLRRIGDKGAAMAMVFPAVFLVEMLIVGWKNCSVRELIVKNSASSLTDMVCCIIGQTPIMKGLRIAASLGVALISAHWLDTLIHRAIGVGPNLAWAPFPLQVAIYFLVYSFCEYWSHRIDHHRWFWPLHRYHHAADEFCILSAERAHPASFTRFLQQTVPAALVGASPDCMADGAMLIIVIHLLIHSRINSNFGWVGRYLLQSPTHHRLHHALEGGFPSGHYGIVPLWDQLFGTWRGEADQSLPIGVKTPYKHGAWLLTDMWRDYCDFWAGIASAVRFRSARLSLRSNVVDAQEA